MADKRAHYTLGFDADTTRAKAQIKDLQNQLNQLANTALNKPDLDYSGQVGKSIQAVNQLQSALQNATNVKTGKLDLTKFNESINSAGLGLDYFHKNLTALGPSGQKAFLSLTQSIVTADTSLVKTSKLLEDMKISLSNTIKWQISSSAIHAFMGTIQGAYRYAQDLNESLNNIRIVTGQNTEQMAAFAKHANSAAKALSSTTVEYTDAALIYYQQGLKDEEVQERAEVTVKMANVSRESAQIVSDQMTAVWNNFYNGSKSLEYYADVMTALGAATASSTDEIATGLEKFAAISNTVGLSYEYATSALATVTATTRQSADVVGTAFRTMFTRIQGLQQGETAEDGVDLNKYSQALANVGIQILDTNGQIKEMDTILNELGEKWKTLGKEQQIALAQTVGGARQYTTLVALMDKWTFFQENLQTSYGATGELNKQQEIYAESWEAARDRVTAALEDIYDSLLNDEFFIELTDAFANIINYIGDFIDALGGAKGILSILSTLMITAFGNEIQKGLSVIQSQINKITGATKKENEELQKLSISLARSTASQMGTDTQAGVIKRTADLYGEINKKYNTLTEQQKKDLDNALEINRVLRERTLELTNQYKQEEKNLSSRRTKAILEQGVDNIDQIDEKISTAEKIGKAQQLTGFLSNKGSDLQKLNEDSEYKKRIDTYLGILSELEEDGVKEASKVAKAISDALAGNIDEKDFAKALNDFEEELDQTIEEIIIKTPNAGQAFSDAIHAAADLGAVEMEKDIAVLNEITANSTVNEWLSNLEKGIPSLGDKIIGFSQIITSFTMVISTLQGTLDTINDPNISGWEKFIAILSATGSVVTTLTFALNAQTISMINQMGASLGLNAALILEKLHLAGASEAALNYAVGMEIATGASLGFIWPILAVVAALGTLYLIFKTIYEAINADKIALEKANEELENAKNAAKEAATAYNDLKSSIDSLNSAEEILSKLTKGTDEWKAAVLELNQQVLDLIDKYPELAQYLDTSGDYFKINEEGLDAVLEKQFSEAQALQFVATASQRDVVKAEQVIAKNELINSFKTESNAEISLKRLQDAAEKAAMELQSLDKNIANSWLNTTSNTVPDELKDYVATGISKYVDEERNIIEKTITNAGSLISDQDFKQAYAQSLLGPDATSTEINQYIEEINQLIKDDKLSMDTIKEYIISSAANQEAYEKVQENIDSINKYKGESGYDTLKNIVASGGDVSSYNALTGAEADAFRELLANSDLDTIFSDESIFGEDFYEKLKNTFSEAQKAAYEEESQKNRDKIFNQKVESTASELGVDSDALEAYIKHLQENNEELKNNRDAALDAAKVNIKWNNGIENLSEVLDDNKDALSSANEGTWDYYEALGKVSKATSELLGIDVSADYVEEHLEDLKKAVEGDEEAIRNLQKTAAVDWAKSFVNDISDVEEEFTYLENGVEKTLSGFNASTWADQFTNVIDDVANKLGSLDTSFTFEADASQPLNELVNLTNQALAAGQMTEAQMKAMFSSMGYTPEVDYIQAPGQSFEDIGNFTIGDPESAFHLNIPYTNTYTQTMTVPQITDKDKSGSVSMTKITTPKPLGGSTKKSSGSGGGSKKDKKSSSKEIERYHVISNEMEEIQNELDKISTATERAFGADKLALIDDEIQKMRELKDAQDEYVRQIEENFEKDKQAIAAYGAVFDKDGTILNYEEIMQRQIDKFNASRTDAAEEEYQKFLDLLKQYEETNDLLDKERNESIKQAGELLDKGLEGIEHKVSLQVEFNDDTIEYLEFLLEQLEDQAFSAAQSIDLLSRQVKENFDNIKSNSSGLAETLALAGFDSETIDGVLTGDQAAINKMMSQKGIDNNIIESVKEYRDALMGSISNVRDLQKAVDEDLINSLDEASEKFGELHDELNHNADILSSLQNIMDLTGESILGFTDDAKKALEDAQLDTAISQVATSYDELTAAQEEYKKAVESDQSEEVIKAAAEKVKEAEEQLLSDWEAALEQATTNFEASIERSVAAFSNAVAGAYGGLDELQDAFDKQEELDDIYIEDYKKIYELTKLSRDISRSIDDSDNIKAKQALRDLQGEINELQKEGVELSEYDIEYLQKKYELRLAEIALEEAQNAKSTVRMTRDSEGNWSYTYTADQDDINEAQQNYEDKLYAIQELSDNYIKDMQSQVLDLLSAYEDEMAKINFSEEGWEQKAKEIEAFYQAKFNLLAQQFEGALGNQSDIYGEWEDYSALTGYGISANQDFIDSFDETTLSQLTGFQTMGEYQQVFTTNSQKLLTDLSGSFMDWRDHVQRIYEQAGKSTEDFAEKVGDMAEGVKEDNQSVVDSSESLKNEVIDNFEEAANGASAFADTWNEKIKTMTDSNNDLVESINDIIEAWARLNNAEEEKNNKQEQNEQEEKNDSSINNSNNNNKTLSENDSVSVKTSATHFATGQQMAGFVPGGSYSVMQVSGDRVLIGRNGVATGWVKKTDLVGFHSGGYTGEWGSSGKLAMLHEKELVLNANDTKNILTSVELMREISQAIDLNASMSAYSNAISAAMPNTGVITNQNIVINAEFPDATDRLEIQAAFDNLLNRASQYANRK